jgi:hypothetical protein
MRAMGAEKTRTSRALPRLLVFVLASCGGRYSAHSDTDGTAGSAGYVFGMPVERVPRGGRSSTGTGGSGVAVGGKSVGMGGSGIGTAGSPIGFAGMATGSGGNNPGYPTDPESICRAYCSAVSALCPQGDAGVCSKPCFREIAGQGVACGVWAWDQYDCITQAFRQAMSCRDGHDLASKLCGSEGATPIACEHQPCGAAINAPRDDYCESLRTCAGGQSELRCVGTPGGATCSCWVNGVRAADVMTTATTARQACIEEELQWLCTKQLP